MFDIQNWIQPLKHNKISGTMNLCLPEYFWEHTREQFSELDNDKKVMEYVVMVLARKDHLDSL